MFLIKDIIAFAGIHIGYFTILECNSKTKGVVLRPDDQGKKVISWSSMKEFMLTPLKKTTVTKELWKPKNWDINYPIVMVGCFGIYKCFGF